MEEFDYRKFLVENKLTPNSRLLNEETTMDRLEAHAGFDMDEDGNMRLSCGATSELLVGEVQPAGKQKMPAQDFINGYRLQVGRSILG